MSTVKYKCDTCKREIEILENREGLDHFSKCIITKGCRGKLYKLQRNPYNVREYFAQPSTSDIVNYSRRLAFFEFKKINDGLQWDITHNMGVYPSVTVYTLNEDTNSYIPIDRSDYEIIINNENSIVLEFTEPTSGVAHLIARSSLDPNPDLVESEKSMTQVTYNNIMSIGVLGKIVDSGTGQYDPTIDTIYTADLDSIFLVVSLKEPNREEVFCAEEFSGNREADSPWVDWEAILSRKRRNYSIWSKNINDFKVIQDLYNDISEIPDGTQLRILKISYGEDDYERDIRARNVLMLLANSPYTTSDKILNRVVDVGIVTDSNTDNYYTFINGELFTLEDFAEPLYPELESATPLRGD
jgi:hypothetical protein